MHVDGFRFDLRSALARSFHDVDMLSSFLTTIQQDPVLSRVKLIAEPWDVGEGGYQVGEFPPLWTSGTAATATRCATAGAARGRRARAGLPAVRLVRPLHGRGASSLGVINFVTSHDGFTLRDLTTYEVKRNDANGEDGRDGEDHNRSWNCGVEGETDDADVNALRRRQARNLLTTLLLSTGVPMLAMGDEVRRTQTATTTPTATTPR
jgi:glycogen operon protein